MPDTALHLRPLFLGVARVGSPTLLRGFYDPSFNMGIAGYYRSQSIRSVITVKRQPFLPIKYPSVVMSQPSTPPEHALSLAASALWKGLTSRLRPN